MASRKKGREHMHHYMIEALLVVIIIILLFNYIPAEWVQPQQPVGDSGAPVATFNATDPNIDDTFYTGENYVAFRRNGYSKKTLVNNKAPHLEDIDAAFWHVFSALPDEILVYPTENYQYFIFNKADKEVWGNIRMSPPKRDYGELSFAYFIFNPAPQHRDDFYTQHKIYDANNGVNVVKTGNLRYSVTYRGKTVVFSYLQIEQTPPKLFSLAPVETFLFRTFDESGHPLFLIFDHNTSSFLWVLNEEGDLFEELDYLSDGLVIGRESRFVFYTDKDYQDRKILVGVYIWNTKQNNYYDGPFDQLADNYIDEALNLSGYIQQAYRYTRGYIDMYGRFSGARSGSRVAITPYISYTQVSEMPEALEWCRENREGRKFYSCLAYDSKKIY